MPSPRRAIRQLSQTTGNPCLAQAPDAMIQLMLRTEPSSKPEPPSLSVLLRTGEGAPRARADSPRTRVALTLLVAVVLSSSVAFAWKRDAEFEARVHGHAFTKISLESADCTLRYKLEFAAPPEAYPKGGTGYYRFHARIQLDGGRSILTNVFGNRTPGKRTFAGALDTTADGCWAKDQRKLFGVDVEGCRGRACVPDPFQ